MHVIAEIDVDKIYNFVSKAVNIFFCFKQKTAYEIGVRLVGSEMCIRRQLPP